MRKLISDYFTLPRWERWAIILLIAVNLFFIIWFSIGSEKELTQTEKIELLKNEKLLSSNSLSKNSSNNKNSSKTNKAEVVVGDFNPNNVTVDFLLSIGLKKPLATRWQKYISKGGKFKKPEDVLKLYGMDTISFNKIKSHLVFEMDTLKKETFKKEILLVDINAADTLQLVALPGIGAATAKRMVSYRNALGGFYSLEQLKDLKSIRPENYELMIARLELKTTYSKIKINSVDEVTLVKHPYFKKGIAGALIAYKQKHGNYINENDLLKCVLVTPEVLQKIKPYIEFE